MRANPDIEPDLPKGLRVFLVEDEMLVRLMMEDSLQELGCEVVASAASLRDGLKMADAVKAIDCAVLDVNLATERVWPLAEKLLDRQIPIILVSGYTLNPEPSFASYLILSKPINVTDLKRGLFEARCKN